MTEEFPLDKPSEEDELQDKWSKSGPVRWPDSWASEADPYDEERWSKSGPMTVPDRGKEAEDAGKNKGKRPLTLADMEGAGGHKAGFEHLREAPTAIAYDQHERLPSEFGRVSILDEDVVTGEVRPGYANPLPSPSSSSQKPHSRRTIRTSVPGSSDAVRASGSEAERLSEEGAHGRESSWGGYQSVSGEFKPPRPVAAAGKGDPSVPGHRRNSSAPLTELSSGEAARVMSLQVSSERLLKLLNPCLYMSKSWLCVPFGIGGSGFLSQEVRFTFVFVWWGRGRTCLWTFSQTASFFLHSGSESTRS